MIIVVICNTRCPLPKTIFNIHFYLFFPPYLSVLFCKSESSSPNFKETFLQNLFTPPNVFLSLLSLIQLLLPLSLIFSLLSHFTGSSVSTDYNVCEPICKSSTHRQWPKIVPKLMAQIIKKPFHFCSQVKHCQSHHFYQTFSLVHKLKKSHFYQPLILTNRYKITIRANRHQLGTFVPQALIIKGQTQMLQCRCFALFSVGVEFHWVLHFQLLKNI